MKNMHPKTVRRRLLLLLYEHFQQDPLELLGPAQLLQEASIEREDLQPNVFYLYDRSLIELMTSYNPPMFSGARITAEGIDLVENYFEFNRQFPPEMGEQEERFAEVPLLVERLVWEADYSPLDGEGRRCLLRDVQYLRDELARPIERWRMDVVQAVMEWIAGNFKDTDDALPSLNPLREILARQVR